MHVAPHELKAIPRPGVPPEEGRSARQEPGAVEVLIIDDDPVGAGLLVATVRALGYTAEVFLSGEAGLRAALRHPPRLLLCDIAIPDLDGFTIARRMRDAPQAGSTGLVAITGHAHIDLAARSVGYEAVLHKPIDTERLAVLLRTPSLG